MAKANYEYLICTPKLVKDQIHYVPVHNPLPSLAMARTVIPFIQSQHKEMLQVVIQEKAQSSLTDALPIQSPSL